MNKLAKWILVMIAVTAVCTATAEAAKWKFKSTDMGYSDPANPDWGVYNGNGWLTVWPTINCDPQGALIEDEYVLGDIEYEGEIPRGQGYNDFMAFFKWDFGCENEVYYKMYVCKDGELVPVPLPKWIDDNLPRGEFLTLPSVGDPTGTDPEIHILVNLRVCQENPAPPPQETYVFNNGVCEELPGYQVGTTPFVHKGKIPCHPFETDNLFTGTLYTHAQIGVLAEVPPPTREPPTVSEWGLIIMALLLVTVGAIMIRKRRQVTA